MWPSPPHPDSPVSGVLIVCFVERTLSIQNRKFSGLALGDYVFKIFVLYWFSRRYSHTWSTDPDVLAISGVSPKVALYMPVKLDVYLDGNYIVFQIFTIIVADQEKFWRNTSHLEISFSVETRSRRNPGRSSVTFRMQHKKLPQAQL